MKIAKFFSVRHLSSLLLLILLVVSCHGLAAKITPYQQIDWIELIPKDDLEVLLNPPDYLANIEDGSEQDSIDSLSATTASDDVTRRFQQALKSVRVIEEFDNKAVKIPGYMVPLANDENQNVTEFFIVPYFGACLHMPPPPPNQMIYGKLTKGFKLTELTEAFWFEGTINIATTNNATGTSAYEMVIDKINIYE